MPDDELFDALDGLSAYDLGATDSGIHDEALRARVLAHLRSLEPHARALVLSRFARETFLTDERLAQGYTIESVLEFFSWLDGQLPWQPWGRHL